MEERSKDSLIQEYRSIIIDRLSVTRSFCARLVQKGVVTHLESENIKMDSIPRATKADMIMDHLYRGPESAWIKFLLCLLEDDQRHIVDAVSGEPEAVREELHNKIEGCKYTVQARLQHGPRLYDFWKNKGIVDTNDNNWLLNDHTAALKHN